MYVVHTGTAHVVTNDASAADVRWFGTVSRHMLLLLLCLALCQHKAAVLK